MKTQREYKLIVLGSGGVGKSSYVMRFVSDLFVEDYDPTIEDTYRKQIKVDGTIYLLELLDTAGYEEWSGFGKYRDAALKHCHGFIFIFSLTDQPSLAYLKEERDKAMRMQDRNIIPHVLIGNKVDLGGEREIPLDEPQRVASTWGCPYFEVSAKTNKNVTQSIEELVRQVNIIHFPQAVPRGFRGGCLLL